MTNETPISALPSGQSAYPPLSEADERTWAMLAHLSVLLNLVTGFLGIVAALLIYLVYKDRSRYVAYQSLQSILMQLVWWLGGGALIGLMWAVSAMLIPVLVGILCLPFAIILTPVLLLMPLVALVYGIVAAIECSQGHDFKYWLIGDWVRGTFTS